MSESKIHIAIVDDDESFARAISRLLRAAGYEIGWYSSAERFLSAASSPKPAVLVLDVHMGGMSGIELQHKLAESGSSLPIVFVTAHDDAETCETAQQAGCIEYLRKPVSRTSLLEALRKAVAASAHQS